MSRLKDLIDLAREPSSERRRELLREVTDVFFTTGQAAQLDPAQMALFDEVMTRLSRDMEEAVRAELAVRVAPSPHAPRGLVRSLANDLISVAEPVLSQSPVLDEDDLVRLARTKGQAHLRALSVRTEVPLAVSDAIVERGDDATLGMLLRNAGARLSRQASEAAVDRAQANPDLHEAVVGRASLPPDLLNDMYFVVEARLRAQIMQRNATLDPGELQAALEAGRNRVAAKDGLLPPDFALAEAEIRSKKAAGDLTPGVLAGYLRKGDRTRFTLALSEMAAVDFQTARRVLDTGNIDALGVICKAAGFDRALFLTFVVLTLDRQGDAIGRAKEYGDLYTELDRETAQRAIRFWRLRRDSGEAAAA